MSQQANPRVIGGFVVGAVVLAVAAVLSFGSGEFFAEKIKYVMYFKGTLSGLSEGSPVLFRGARIGSVTQVVVRYHTEQQEARIPVYIEFDRSSVQFVGGELPLPGAGVEEMIKSGLKAKLVSQSMITGQLAILLDFFPEDAEPLVDADDDVGVQELPTVPSLQEQLDDLFKAFQNVPIGDLVSDLRHAVQGIDELVRSGDVRKVIQTLDATLLDFQKLAQNVDARIEPIVSSFEQTSGEARTALKQARESIASVEGRLNGALDDIRQLAKNLDGKVNPLVTSLQAFLQTGRESLQQAQKTLASAEGVVNAESPTVYALNDALGELTATLRSIRALAEYLQQHPEALLQGKRMPGGP